MPKFFKYIAEQTKRFCFLPLEKFLSKQKQIPTFELCTSPTKTT